MSDGRQTSAPSTTSAILASIRKTVVREVERGKSKEEQPADESPAESTAADADASPTAEGERDDAASTDSDERQETDPAPERNQSEPSDSGSESEGGMSPAETAEAESTAEEASQSSAEGDDGGEVLTLTEADMVKDGNEDQPSEETVDDKKTDAEVEQTEGKEGAELVSAAAAAATVAALSKLEGLAQPSATADMRLGNPMKTIEDLVREEIRPVLRLWLDENLPAIVETVVEREVERLVRARRR